MSATAKSNRARVAAAVGALLVACLLLAGCAQDPKARLIGTWQKKDGSVRVEFLADGAFVSSLYAGTATYTVGAQDGSPAIFITNDKGQRSVYFYTFASGGVILSQKPRYQDGPYFLLLPVGS